MEISRRRLKALIYKEWLQIFRDPSSKIIAFVLPVVLLFIYGYGINLDSNKVKIGLLSEDTSPEARLFSASLFGSQYLEVESFSNREDMEEALINGQIRGFIIIMQDFSEKLRTGKGVAALQVIVDGSLPNTATFLQAYIEGVWEQWLAQRAMKRGTFEPIPIVLEPQYWFNPSAESRNFIIPGSITDIITVIGAMLTSLVIAREWERGTMESLLASPVTRSELLLSKSIPYYILGMASLLLCVAVAVWILGVPFRGSLLMLLIVGSAFLFSVLGMGLWVSTILPNQFDAAQAGLNLAFLPATMLSGFIYEISSMPMIVRAITYLIPARYFVSSMQTLFLAGDVWDVLWIDTVFLAGSGILFMALAAKYTRRRID